MSINTIIERQSYKDACNSVGLSEKSAESIISMAFKDTTSQEHPRILHTLGVPGSGKSTYISSLDQTNTVVIAFDKVMETIPDYKEDVKNLGPEASFNKWELPARAIGYEVLHRAVNEKRNVIFDHSGARQDHVDFLQALKQDMDYRVEIASIEISDELAALRVLKREQNGGRYVPPEYIPQRQEAIRKLLPLYQDLADSFTQLQAIDDGAPLLSKTSKTKNPIVKQPS